MTLSSIYIRYTYPVQYNTPKVMLSKFLIEITPYCHSVVTVESGTGIWRPIPNSGRSQAIYDDDDVMYKDIITCIEWVKFNKTEFIP